MYDIKPLEDDWKKYKLKKRKPFYVLILIVFFSSIFIYISLLDSTKGFKIFDEFSKKIDNLSKFNSMQSTSYSKSSILINSSLHHLELHDPAKTIKEESSDSSSELLVDIPILDIEKDTLLESKVSKRKGKVHLDIFETTSVTAYKDVERRFRQSGDIDDALFLAKSYYKKGDYEKSRYWAFEANKLNSSSEESFFIFVKSKAKLGNINEAISLLNTYLKRTNSHEARTLLNELKNGKI